MSDVMLQQTIDMLGQLVGAEAAEKAVTAALRAASLSRRESYTPDEFISACEHLKTQGPQAKVFAQLMMSGLLKDRQLRATVEMEQRQRGELIELNAHFEKMNFDLRVANEKLIKSNEVLREQFLRTEKLAIIGQLASSIAHDLRNPLTTIKNIRFYIERYHKTTDPKMHEFLSLLSTDIERINTVLSDLIYYSQAKIYAKTEAPIADLLEAGLEPARQAANVRVSLAIDDPACMVYVDGEKVTQVFINIVTNACEALREAGGTLKVTVASEEDPVVRARFVRVTFADSGPGITRDQQDQIFEPLYTTKTGRVGLGLAIAKDIIEGHGGTIWVDSGETGGASMVIRLPLEVPSPAEPQ